MKASSTQEATARYYSRLGSRLGYRLVMKKSQHFGYYDKTHTNETSAQQKYHQEFAKLLSLKSGQKLLDAGCGQGVVACYLAREHDVEVTGITIVPYEVKSAEKLAKKQGVTDKTHFILADYAAPPFPPESFDRVYTTETLSHAPDVKQVIHALMTVVKPGGKLVFAEYEFDFEKFPERGIKAAEFVKKHAAIHGIYQFGTGNFKSILRQAKLRSITEIDWTHHVMPSLVRLRHLAKPVAKVVKALRVERYFVNSVAADTYAEAAELGVFSYKIYTAYKPK